MEVEEGEVAVRPFEKRAPNHSNGRPEQRSYAPVSLKNPSPSRISSQRRSGLGERHGPYVPLLNHPKELYVLPSWVLQNDTGVQSVAQWFQAAARNIPRTRTPTAHPCRHTGVALYLSFPELFESPSSLYVHVHLLRRYHPTTVIHSDTGRVRGSVIPPPSIHITRVRIVFFHALLRALSHSFEYKPRLLCCFSAKRRLLKGRI